MSHQIWTQLKKKPGRSAYKRMTNLQQFGLAILITAVGLFILSLDWWIAAPILLVAWVVGKNWTRKAEKRLIETASLCSAFDIRCKTNSLTPLMTTSDFQQTISIAEGFMTLGNPSEAWDILEDLPPDAKVALPVLLLRVTILLALEEWEKAEILAEGCIRCVPSSAGLWYSLAVAQIKQRKIQEAREALKRAFELDESLRAIALKDDDLAKMW